jgi:hypothetical protein
MSLYSQDHPYSNGLEILLDGSCRDWPTLFALVCERLQKIELELADARREISELKASATGVTQCDDSSSPPGQE